MIDEVSEYIGGRERETQRPEKRLRKNFFQKLSFSGWSFQISKVIQAK